MAQHQATLKSIRQNVGRTKVNSDRRSRIRTFIKKVEEAISKGDKAAAQSAFIEAQKELSRGVGQGVLKANTASRKISRLNMGVKNIATSTTKSTGKKAASKKASDISVAK